jgi:hypothetical protein
VVRIGHRVRTSLSILVIRPPKTGGLGELFWVWGRWGKGGNRIVGQGVFSRLDNPNVNVFHELFLELFCLSLGPLDDTVAKIYSLAHVHAELNLN